MRSSVSGLTDVLSPEREERLLAIVDMVGRTGADNIQFRWSDDEEPVVWFVVAAYDDGSVWDAAAGREPVEAAERLATQLIDGGTCTRCGRTTALQTDWQSSLNVFAERVGMALCEYAYDPELKRYRRSCEDGVAA
jgi:hypothetical protein